MLGNHGGDVTVTVVPGLEHDILLEPVALDALTMLVETLVKDAQRQKVCGEIRRDPIDFRTLACRRDVAARAALSRLIAMKSQEAYIRG